MIVRVHTESVSPEHRYCRFMALLTEAEMNDFADRLLAAIGAADEVALREVYDPQAAVWHNFDERDQTVDENLAMLHDMHRRLQGFQYTEVRRALTADGFVQQHVLVGQAMGGALRMPAMIRFYVANGRITRLEEYLDTRQAMVMYQA